MRLAPVLLAFALYAGVLQLVAFDDDVHNIPVIATRTILSVFDIQPYGHWDYRPLIAALWLIPRDLFGDFPAAILHWYNLAAHTVATALVVGIAQRAVRGRAGPWAGAAAGVWFATTPFAQQAVPWAGALSHVLMTTFGLAGMLVMRAALARGSVWRALLAAGLVVLACFSHESGFVYGALIPLVAGGLLWLRGWRPTRRAWLAGAAVGLTGAGYALAYRLLITGTVWQGASAEGGIAGQGLADILTNYAYSLQAVVYPLVVLLRYPILDVLSLPATVVAAVYALAAVAVLPALLVLRRARLAGLGALLAAWWWIALGPAAVFLGADYFTTAARVQYIAAPAAALWWGAVVAGGMRSARPRLATGAALAVVLIGAAWGARYVGERDADVLAYSDGVRVIAARLQASRPGERVLFINYPVSSTPKLPGPAFLLGNEAMSYAEITKGPVMRHVTALNGIDRPSLEVRHDLSFTPSARYLYFVAGKPLDDPPLRQAVLGSDVIFRWEYGGDRMRARWLGAFVTPGGAATTAEFREAGARVLLSGARAGICGGAPWLALEWQTPQPSVRQATVFVHGYDASGAQVLDADADPLGALLPLEMIPPGNALAELRALPAPAARVAELRIGVYAREDGKRWQALRPDGGPWNGDEVVVPIDGGCNPAIQRAR